MVCKNCSCVIEEGTRFCNNCGETMMGRCSHCSCEIREGSKFCHNCGDIIRLNLKCVDCAQILDKDDAFCNSCGRRQSKYKKTRAKQVKEEMQEELTKVAEKMDEELEKFFKVSSALGKVVKSAILDVIEEVNKEVENINDRKEDTEDK